MVCSSCKAAPHAYKASKDEAIGDWNRRAPQTLTVIVPQLEWGEWRLGVSQISFIESKCGGYRIEQDCGFYYAWTTAQERLAYEVKTWEEAIAACQAHAQATVNAALEGCKIEPFRSPKGLADALGRISNMPIPWYKDGHPSEKEIAQTALKAWESRT